MNASANPESAEDGVFPSDLLFEISWEVCNQVGGIYTVMKTKIPSMLERWEDRYFLIGPYHSHNAAIEFEEQQADDPLIGILNRLRDEGIPCFFGRWLVTGTPQTILIDYRIRHLSLDADKYLLWRDNGLETPQGDTEINDAVAFGFCVTEFFQQILQSLPDRRVIAHFHEWQSAVALPRIAHLRLGLGTIFTTHATLLGRYMAADNPGFYRNLPHLDSDALARHYNIFSRHSLEKAAAHSASLFSTISDITAREAEIVLGRRADFILPNGINTGRYIALHEFQVMHLQFKERIHEFIMAHFFPSYTFDLDRTIYIFTSGRYEYRNKGMDIFIESIYQLNQRLKSEENPPTVVAFIITRADVHNINVQALRNRIQFDELKRICSETQEAVGRSILNAVSLGRLPEYDEFLPESVQSRLRRNMHALKSDSPPGIVTHDLKDDFQDPVLNHLRHRGLLNGRHDPVKVVFHPEFLTVAAPLLGLDYDQFVRGCHLGIFPSYYEPWGYTPPECLACGLPTVTSDLSGFGAFVKDKISYAREKGIFVLPRWNVSVERSIELLADYLIDFARLERRERIGLRNRAERVSEKLDWSYLVDYYHQAHDAVLETLSD